MKNPKMIDMNLVLIRFSMMKRNLGKSEKGIFEILYNDYEKSMISRLFEIDEKDLKIKKYQILEYSKILDILDSRIESLKSQI